LRFGKRLHYKTRAVGPKAARLMLTPLLVALLWLFDTVVGLYIIVIIAAVVVSWLVAFGVLNTYNPLARSLIRALDALTEPLFRRVRRIIPAMGGLDLSPMIVLILLYFIRMLVDSYATMAIYSMHS
jgi:YggT family protein